MGKIRINAGSRIHFGLLDLTGDLGRVDGSLGLYLSRPRILIEAEASNCIHSNSRKELVKFAVAELNKYYGTDEGLKVNIIDSYKPHVGLGSSTQLLLSIGMAFCELHHLDWTPVKLGKILGRGGTSGIGVASFERGGFILDAGHSFGPCKEKTDFLPSRASNSPPAPVLFHKDFPSDWVVELVIPEKGKKISGQREVDFFRSHCPVPPSESAKIARIVISLILPGILGEDITTFIRGINLLTTLGFKKAEIDNQFNDLKQTLQNLKQITQGSAAIGMSSFGPTLFIIWNKKIKSKYSLLVNKEIKNLLDVNDGIKLTTTSRNSGAKSKMIV